MEPRHHVEHSPRAILALLLGIAGISFAPMFTRDVQTFGGVGPTVAAFWRVALAAPLMFLFMVILRGYRTTRGACLGRSDWLMLAIPGLFFAGDLVSWHWSFEYTTQANATLLANVAVILVSLASWLWLKERLTKLFVVGGGLAFVGVSILMGVDFELGGGRVFGNSLALGTAFFYGSYLFSVKLLRGRYTTLQVMGMSSAACAVMVLPFALAVDEQFFPTSTGGWLSAFGLAWIAHCLGQGSVAYALARLPASFAVVSLLAQPVAVSVIEAWRYGERLTGLQMLGGCVVLVGIGMARWGSRRRRVRRAGGDGGLVGR